MSEAPRHNPGEPGLGEDAEEAVHNHGEPQFGDGGSTDRAEAGTEERAPDADCPG